MLFTKLGLRTFSSLHCTCQSTKCSFTIVLTASLLHTSLLSCWHANSFTSCTFTRSHLPCCCPSSLAYEKNKQTYLTHTSSNTNMPAGWSAFVSLHHQHDKVPLTVSNVPLWSKSIGGLNKSCRVFLFRLDEVPIASCCSVKEWYSIKVKCVEQSNVVQLCRIPVRPINLEWLIHLPYKSSIRFHGQYISPFTRSSTNIVKHTLK